MTDRRSTGWRVPLLFCAGIVGLVVVISAFLPKAETQPRPEFNNSLLSQAKALQIDLQKDHAGRAWHSEITSAGSGFVPQAEKDAKLGVIIDNALNKQRYDAACAASVLVEDATLRDALRLGIVKHAVAACESLPWAVMGAYGMDDTAVYNQAYSLIEEAYSRCRGQ